MYGASKAALDHLTAAAADEIGPNGIRIHAFLPGAIDTDMNAIWRTQVAAFAGHPELVADRSNARLGAARAAQEDGEADGQREVLLRCEAQCVLDDGARFIGCAPAFYRQPQLR